MDHNLELAKIFLEMAEYLRIKEVAFKPQAYERASLSLESLDTDIGTIYQKGGIKALEEITGIGKNLAAKIEEYLKTGQVKEYRRFKKELPVDLAGLTSVEGIGPKMVAQLYQQLKIKTVTDLERAALAGKIKNLPHFGVKSEQNILQSLGFLKKSQGRFLLGEIWPPIAEIIAGIKKIKGVKQLNPAGSLRRKKETIGDADILAVALNPQKVMDYFCSMKGVEKVWAHGLSRSSVRLQQGFDVDLRIIDVKSYGAALQYFTGSKEHNVKLRQLAIEQGLKLNEYGLFRGAKMMAGATEESIYQALGLAYLEPELREDQGEIELALHHPQDLPELIPYGSLKGDLHIHCNWDGGVDSIEELALSAMALGYQYIGLADHTHFLKIEHGLNESQLSQRNKEIEKVNAKLKQSKQNLRVLAGCEANIMADGSLDISDQALARQDFVIAGVHSQLKMNQAEMSQRLIKAMSNKHVDIIAHPTGRLIKQRDEFAIDFDQMLKAAKDTKTVLEINASPWRLDLKDSYIKRAKASGVKMAINSDSHQKDQLAQIEYGLAQARRGWLTKADVINAWPADKMFSFLKGT